MKTALAPGLGLRSHNFVLDNPGLTLHGRLITTFADMVDVQKSILERHAENPFDIIVGDDVSGRVPTLITHRLLRLAQAGGHITTVPYTYFMTSGMYFGNRPGEWQNNLDTHAGRLIGQAAARNVLVITELVSSGTSVRRLKDAFAVNGVEVSHVAAGSALYLNGHGSPARQAVCGGRKVYPRAGQPASSTV